MSIRLYDFCFIIFSVLTPPLSAIFQLYHGFRGGRSRSTQREPPTMGKQLVNLIKPVEYTLFGNLQSRRDAVLVIGLYELLGNPTT
jgi:hypothetical protein